jgi:hypothetical protein
MTVSNDNLLAWAPYDPGKFIQWEQARPILAQSRQLD